MRKFAIFSDIDGTLVSFTTHQVPESAVKALAEAKLRGHKFYISTGRPTPIITNLSQVERYIDGYITTNGAYCFVGSQTVSCHAIDPEDVAQVLADADQQHYAVLVVGEHDLVVHHFTEQVERILHQHLGVDTIDYTKPLSALKGQRILQLTPFINTVQEATLMARLHHCFSARWHPEFTDITSDQANKGKGLLAIARHEGFCLADTIALGDGGNDIPILQQAGIGVAMGNSGEKTQQAANYVTRHIDDGGFAHALRHYGIIS